MTTLKDLAAGPLINAGAINVWCAVPKRRCDGSSGAGWTSHGPHIWRLDTGTSAGIAHQHARHAAKVRRTVAAGERKLRARGSFGLRTSRVGG